MTACIGSGLDICSFSILCILFRISEKVATPTSIVLMATNSLLGLSWRQLMTDGKVFHTIHFLIIFLLYCCRNLNFSAYCIIYNYITGGAEKEAWEYLAVCAPVVFFCAPMGSLIASHFHRQGNLVRTEIHRMNKIFIISIVHYFSYSDLFGLILQFFSFQFWPL